MGVAEATSVSRGSSGEERAWSYSVGGRAARPVPRGPWSLLAQVCHVGLAADHENPLATPGSLVLPGHSLGYHSHLFSLFYFFGSNYRFTKSYRHSRECPQVLLLRLISYIASDTFIKTKELPLV